MIDILKLLMFFVVFVWCLCLKVDFASDMLAPDRSQNMKATTDSNFTWVLRVLKIYLGC